MAIAQLAKGITHLFLH